MNFGWKLLMKLEARQRFLSIVDTSFFSTQVFRTWNFRSKQFFRTVFFRTWNLWERELKRQTNLFGTSQQNGWTERLSGSTSTLWKLVKSWKEKWDLDWRNGSAYKQQTKNWVNIQNCYCFFSQTNLNIKHCTEWWQTNESCATKFRRRVVPFGAFVDVGAVDFLSTGMANVDVEWVTFCCPSPWISIKKTSWYFFFLGMTGRLFNSSFKVQMFDTTRNPSWIWNISREWVSSPTS